MKTKGTFYDRKSKERRSQIIRISKKLILEKGLAGVTMLGIAKKVGISRQMLYKYFSNLDEVAYTIQTEDMGAFIHYMNKISDESKQDDPLKKVEGFLNDILSYESKHKEDFIFTIDFDTYFKDADLKKDLREKYVASFKNPDFISKLNELLIQGQNCGVFKKDFSAEEYSYCLINFTQAIISRIALMETNRVWGDEQGISLLKKSFVKAVLSNIENKGA